MSQPGIGNEVIRHDYAHFQASIRICSKSHRDSGLGLLFNWKLHEDSQNTSAMAPKRITNRSEDELNTECTRTLRHSGLAGKLGLPFRSVLNFPANNLPATSIRASSLLEMQGLVTSSSTRRALGRLYCGQSSYGFNTAGPNCRSPVSYTHLTLPTTPYV